MDTNKNNDKIIKRIIGKMEILKELKKKSLLGKIQISGKTTRRKK